MDGEYRKVLSFQKIKLPSLPVFGCSEGKEALLPVLEHRHHGKFEFVITVRGIQRYLVNGIEETVYSGEAFIIRPDEIHACILDQPIKSKVFWFQIDVSDSSDFLGLSDEDAQMMYCKLMNIKSRKVTLTDETVKNLGCAFRLLCKDDRLYKLEGRWLFLCCFLEILNAPAVMYTLSHEVDLAIQYIYVHIKEAIDIDELLLVSGLSIKELKLRFQSEIGCSPREYIIHEKIRRVKEEISNTHKSIADIAYQYHFSSVGFFRIRFKQQTGMSVKKYRKKMQNKK